MKDRYCKDAYRQAVARGVEKANKARVKEGLPPLPHWHPNQLRHTAGTEIRQRFGLEAAQVVLGHSKADVTQVYAERDQRLAVEVARQVG
jgi:integrase